MKLPDFRKDTFLNELKRKMGVSESVFSIFNPGIIDLPPDDRTAILSGIGKEVPPEDIKFEDDGTFSYKGTRIVIHIGDVNTDTRRSEDFPRYHVIQCKTIKQKKNDGTFGRYIVNAEPDGNFKIKIISNNVAVESFQKLIVCQYCLSELGFWGFRIDMPSEAKDEILAEFSPKDFFEAYPMSLFEELPEYDAESLPANVYAKDWKNISYRQKVMRDFTCEVCHDCLRDLSLRKYLETHHKGMQKFNNRSKDLEVLCIKCHAERPAHSHLKSSPRYKEYMLLRSNAGKRSRYHQ